MVLVTSGLYLIGAIHIDAPTVGSLTTGSTAADITYFVFESPSNSDNYVFDCNVLGFSAPGDDINLDHGVVEVTLILTFGSDLTNVSAGLMGDDVSYTRNSICTFCYLGSPN